MSVLRSYGWTIALTVVALAIHALGLGVALQFDRGLAMAEPWRVLTGHLTHWHADHMFWDVVMFAALAATLEPRSRARFLACAVSAAIAIPAAIVRFRPEVVTYRGLSGIDSTLFVLAVGLLLREAFQEGRRRSAALLLLAAAGLAGKLAFELVTGTTLFVESSTFAPVALAHVIGGAVGLAFVGWDLVRGERRGGLRRFSPGRGAPATVSPADPDLECSLHGTHREPPARDGPRSLRTRPALRPEDHSSARGSPHDPGGDRRGA